MNNDNIVLFNLNMFKQIFLSLSEFVEICFKHLAPVAQKVDSAIQ